MLQKHEKIAVILKNILFHLPEVVTDGMDLGGDAVFIVVHVFLVAGLGPKLLEAGHALVAPHVTLGNTGPVGPLVDEPTHLALDWGGVG